MLRRLQTTARLMQVTAHPDDEDGGMLTLESRGKGVSTLLMTLTRGEGGQNKLGSNLFDALGVLRARLEDRLGPDADVVLEVRPAVPLRKRRLRMRWANSMASMPMPSWWLRPRRSNRFVDSRGRAMFFEAQLGLGEDLPCQVLELLRVCVHRSADASFQFSRRHCFYDTGKQ